MKNRIGFVSNSSSSSFILSTDKNVTNQKITIELDLNDLEYNSINNKQELDDYFVEQYCWSNEPTIDIVLENNNDLNELYNQYLKELENNKKLTLFSVSSDNYDNPFEQALYNLYQENKLEELFSDNVKFFELY